MAAKVVSFQISLPETKGRIGAATKAACDSSPKRGSCRMQTQFASLKLWKVFLPFLTTMPSARASAVKA